jgi:hypothetical protein
MTAATERNLRRNVLQREQAAKKTSEELAQEREEAAKNPFMHR